VLAELMALCNQLYDIVKGASLVGEVTARTRDLILSFGEQLSAYLVYQVIKQGNNIVTYADARLLIRTDASYGHARVDHQTTNKLIGEYFSKYRGIIIIPGFIASTSGGQTTTLGRNGSDYTASLLGAALDAESIEIWSDTDGVMTADPQYVEKARNIVQLSYSEAMELSHFGARIIFPASLQPVMAKRIPVLVKNTFNPGHKGTLICNESNSNNGIIKGITSLRKVCLVNVEGCGMVGVAGIAARMFTALSLNNISVIFISQASSEHSICISILQEEEEKATTILKSTFSEELASGLISSVGSESALAIVAVVGEKMKNMPGVAARVFEPLGRNGINIKAISQGSSELNISFVIHEDDLPGALNVLHDSMFN
jgi:aspartokinase/homoserine dehydrogenase 1